MAWKTVAICDEHWKEEEGQRIPVRMNHVDGFEGEPCYRCGKLGDIFVRREVNV